MEKCRPEKNKSVLTELPSRSVLVELFAEAAVRKGWRSGPGWDRNAGGPSAGAKGEVGTALFI